VAGTPTRRPESVARREQQSCCPSPAIAADGTIYVGTYDNKLLAIH
jgi:hypothetical protein